MHPHDPPQWLHCLTVHRPILDGHHTIRGVCQLLKRPEGQVKVVVATATPILGADLLDCAVWALDGVLAGAGVTDAYNNRLGVIPALGVEKVLFLLGVSYSTIEQPAAPRLPGHTTLLVLVGVVDHCRQTTCTQLRQGRCSSARSNEKSQCRLRHAA
jgi:hypothetical protein